MVTTIPLDKEEPLIEKIKKERVEGNEKKKQSQNKTLALSLTYM